MGLIPYGQQGYQGYPGGPGYAPVQAPEGRMTFDDVVTKTAVTMAILIASAALAWMFVPAPLYFPALILSALVGFGVVLLVAVRRNISPGLVLVYAAIEGVFIGMISKYFETYYEGIVVQAVIGTFAAAGVTLAAYKFFNIRVTPKFQKIVIISTIAFALGHARQLRVRVAGCGDSTAIRHDRSGWPAGHRRVTAGRGLGGAQPGARLRLHRARRGHGCAGEGVLARRVRTHGDHGVAVRRAPAPAVLPTQVARSNRLGPPSEEEGGP